MKEKIDILCELRVGSWVYAKGVPVYVHYVTMMNGRYVIHHLPNMLSSGYGAGTTDIDDIKPIPLTYELLEDLGFKHIPHFTVTKSMEFDLGRNRFLSIGCVGTPNEILWLSQHNEVPEDLICLHNFDYDGKLYLHKLQNIVSIFNKKLHLLVFPTKEENDATRGN